MSNDPKTMTADAPADNQTEIANELAALEEMLGEGDPGAAGDDNEDGLDDGDDLSELDDGDDEV